VIKSFKDKETKRIFDGEYSKTSHLKYSSGQDEKLICWIGQTN